MSVEHQFVVTVHNQETEVIHVIRVTACGAITAAQMAVIVVFREVGWHHVRCHTVVDVEQVAS